MNNPFASHALEVFCARAGEKLKSALESDSAAILGGFCDSFERYRYYVGRIEGFRSALSVIETERRRLTGDERGED